MARDSITASDTSTNESFVATSKRAINRRRFIKRMALVGAVTVGGTTIVGGGKFALDRIWRGRELARREQERPGGERWFTRAEHGVVVALCGVIVPADESGPGALEVGVVERLDRMLAQSSNSRPLYARGLLAFDELAHRQRGRGFAELADKEKIVLVQDLEKHFQETDKGASLMGQLGGKATALYRSWPEGAAANLFALLVEDTMAMFYSSPAAWNSLAYDGPPFSRAYIANFGPCGPVVNTVARDHAQS